MKTQILILLMLTTSLFHFTFNESKVVLDNQEITGKVIGKITDIFSGSSISNATIIVNQNGTIIKSAKSGSDGKFSFENLLEGNYEISITHKNYETYKKSISVSKGKNTVINISMSPKIQIISDEKVLEEVKIEEISIKEKSKSEDYFIAPSVSTCSRKQSGNVKYNLNSVGYADYDNNIAFNTEAYDVINENNYKEVLSDPLSTFSIDVDRASYSNVRRFITQNTLPHKDVVRIEEMINYFDYEYPQPKSGEPFSINLEMNKCPWNEEHKLLMIGLQGEEVSTEKIPASNLVFLIDVSGSMSSANKLPLLKQSFKILVDKLREEDRVAIVVYAGAAGLVLPSTSGKEKSKIMASLDLLQAGGSTAGGEGIKLAYKVAKENFIKEGNNRVILATDGDFNIGASSDAEMVSLIEDKRKDGVFLTVLGFGMGNYKDSKMEKISNAGNGNYAYIDNIMEAKKIFGKELWGTIYTIAKDVKFQIEFNPSIVKAYRLIGYENRILNKEDFNDDKKDAGDIGSGHTVTALYEVILADSKEQINNVDKLEYQANKVIDSKNLMTVKLRYKKPSEDISNLIVKRYTKNELEKSEVSPNFALASSVAEFGMLLRDSEHKANSSFGNVLTLAKLSKGLDTNGYRSDFIKMVETASLLSR